MSQAGPFDYSVFGLHVRSELPLPELLLADPLSKPDVTVTLGEVSRVAPSADLRPIDGGLVLAIAGVARYAIVDGSEIVVDPEPGVPEANVRLYLLGSAMGVLLHQRGLLPLHANAVEIAGKAVAFMGASGEGKSTLAAWFHDLGYPIIADDVCVVRFDAEGQPTVSPGLPRLRLWLEAMEAMGRDASQFDRSYAGHPGLEKYDVPVAATARVETATPLGLVYVLAQGDEFGILPLEGLQKSEAVFAHTYRGSFLSAIGTVPLHWQSCVELVRRTPIFQVMRTKNFSAFAGQVDAIVAHATAMLADTSPSGSNRGS